MYRQTTQGPRAGVRLNIGSGNGMGTKMEKIGFDVFQDVLFNLCEGVRIIDPTGRVAFWNKGAEIITGYTSAEALGAPCRNSLHIQYNGNPADSMCVNSCPLSPKKPLTLQTTPQAPTVRSGPEEQKAYLRHKDGYLVPVLICTKPLYDVESTLTGVVEMFHDMSWNMVALERIEELSRLSLVDPLTSAGNRRFAEMNVNSRLDEQRRYGVSFGLVYLDLDRFKDINDTYGHKDGDRLLQIAARSMKAILRPYDTLCRLGGDEFLAVAPNIGDRENLRALAERLCQCIRDSSLPVEGKLEVALTASVGAAMARTGDTFEDLVARADDLMYKSKEAGRDRVTVG